MNFYSLYNLRFKNKKIDNWYDRLFVRAVNIILPMYYYISRFLIRKNWGQSSDLNSNNKYIVSLTSFPIRIDTLWIVIESILRQKEKPDAIILWLYKGEFNGKKSLPKSLLRLEKWIQIKFCDENLMSHKKYFYTMKKYPDANVITIDDDIIYPPTLIGDLKKCHKKHPKSICSSTTRFIEIDNDTIQPYADWSKSVDATRKAYKLQQVGFGGVLYPPNSLHKEVFNVEVLKQKALKADDLWLKVMSLKNETKVVRLSNARQWRFIPLIIKQNRQLYVLNVKGKRNDKILRAILDYYKLPDSIFEEGYCLKDSQPHLQLLK